MFFSVLVVIQFIQFDSATSVLDPVRRMDTTLIGAAESIGHNNTK
jgi:hypothetical protein